MGVPLRGGGVAFEEVAPGVFGAGGRLVAGDDEVCGHGERGSGGCFLQVERKFLDGEFLGVQE